MPFQLSPGVNVSEIDLTTVVPAVASSDGAIAGIFNWGPVGQRILIDTETKLAAVFGKPNNNNAETWFTAANFLSYGNRLNVVRAANTTSVTSTIGALNALANVGSVSSPVAQVVKNSIDFESNHSNTQTGEVFGFDSNVIYLAKYPGSVGNSLRISVCDSSSAFGSTLQSNALNASENKSVNLTFNINTGDSRATLAFNPHDTGTAADANLYATHWLANVAIGDYISLGNTIIGVQYGKVASFANTANTKQTSLTYTDVAVSNSLGTFVSINFEDPYRLSTNFQSNGTINTTIQRNWEFFNAVDSIPGTSDYVNQFGNSAAVDQMHVVVVDDGGKFTGSPGTVLEVFAGVSRASDAKTKDGATNYYKTVINQSSQYVWLANDRSGAQSNTSLNISSSTNGAPLDIMFTGGTDGYTETTAPLSVIASGYDKFASAEDVDISLVLQGKPISGTSTDSGSGLTVTNYQLANYIIDNVAEIRKDCVVFITPSDSMVYGNVNNEANAIVAWRNALRSSSYAVMDSGYKYQYDKYNDVYRYIPSNGDIAGLCARTDANRDPWWSPAGLNRGQIKNIVKLRFNPRKSDRDILYKNGVNPLTTFPGQGTVLYGDKTLLSQPSAFDRINVRRLFIVLEKAISTAAKFTLFEFNDEFTRAQFKNLVTPYLRDVQGRRGITNFLVVCDSSNNTPERIDRNEFWGDIYIKPARSINFIQLNFVAVRTGVQFSEVVGQF